MKLSYLEKLKNLRDLRQSIKKRKVLLDESLENFGLQEIKQLAEVKNEDQIKGYPFLAVDKKTNNKFSLKIVPIEKKYNKAKHPSLLECIFLKELTDNVIHKHITPHVVYYLGYQKVSNHSKALKFLNLRQYEIEGAIHTHSNMLIADYIEGGSLDNWIYDVYENKEKIDDTQWKIIAFQLIYTLAIFQKRYKMMHNDCHYGNILMDTSIKPGGYFVYKINNKKYYLPNTGVIPKFWDFEFTMAYNDKIETAYHNQYVVSEGQNTDTESSEENVPHTYNEVYDLHYLLTSLLDLYISEELFNWILKLYPEELIPEDPSEHSDSYTASTTTNTANTSKSMTITTEETTEETDEKNTGESINSMMNKLSVSTETFHRDYLKDHRIINGMERYFKLPNPMELLKDDLFSSFLTKPDDYSEHNSFVFESGF